MIAAGALAGAAWAFVPALLRVRLGIDEVVTTLLLNPVALLVVKALVQGPWRDPGGITESPPIAAAAEFPQLIEKSAAAPGLPPRARAHPGHRLVRAVADRDRPAAARRGPVAPRRAVRGHQGRAVAAAGRAGQRCHRGHRGRQRGGWAPGSPDRRAVAGLRLYRHRGRDAGRSVDARRACSADCCWATSTSAPTPRSARWTSRPRWVTWSRAPCCSWSWPCSPSGVAIAWRSTTARHGRSVSG